MTATLPQQKSPANFAGLFAIINKADCIDADLIVTASHGRGGVGALVLGSVTGRS